MRVSRKDNPVTALSDAPRAASMSLARRAPLVFGAARPSPEVAPVIDRVRVALLASGPSCQAPSFTRFDSSHVRQIPPIQSPEPAFPERLRELGGAATPRGRPGRRAAARDAPLRLRCQRGHSPPPDSPLVGRNRHVRPPDCHLRGLRTLPLEPKSLRVVRVQCSLAVQASMDNDRLFVSCIVR